MLLGELTSLRSNRGKRNWGFLHFISLFCFVRPSYEHSFRFFQGLSEECS